MTGTSIDLAIKNLTTVERLRAKTVVHIMAIRKPPGGQPYQTGHPQIENVPYREIIYPLDVTSISGQFPVRELSQRPRDYDREEGLARGGPLSNPNGEQNQGTEGNVPNRPQTESRGQPVDDQLDPSVGNISGPSDLVNGVTSLSGVQQTESGLLRHNRPQPHPPPQGSRDFQASRTFAVVHSLKPGDNPWDLGNAMLNMKTVMGNTVLEWFLPTASPCLNHDSTESQFAIGPAVKRLRAEHGLSAQQEMAEVTNDWEKTNPRVARPLSGEHSYTAFHNDDRSSDPSSESIKLQTLPVRT
jgi:palmitoyltransferase